MIEATLETGAQGRLKLAPTDRDGNPVTLDPDAVVIAAIRDTPPGSGSAPQGPDTNVQTLFRIGPNIGDTAEFDVKIDAHPGSGTNYLPETVKLTRVPLDAVSAGITIATEPDGTAP